MSKSKYISRYIKPFLILSVIIFYGIVTDSIGAKALTTAPSIQTESVDQRIVEGIEFRGNRRIPSDTIRLYVTIKEGDLYNEEQVQRDYQSILAQGFFDEFESSVTKEDGPRGGVIIVFALRERQIIRDIQYEGLKSVQQSDVITRYKEKRISLTKDSQLDPVQIKHAEDELKRMLSEKGRPDATVKAETEEISATTVVVVFNIDEGPRVRVLSIDFEGNSVFSDRKLRSAMKLTKQSSLFTRFTSKDVYDPGKFGDDLIRVKQFLVERGYLKPIVGEPKIEDLGRVGSSIPIIGKSGRGLKITVPVEEGLLYRFGEIKAEGSTIFTPEQVIQISGMKTGEIASGKTIREGVFERLKKAYGSQGYIQAEMNLDQNFKVSTGAKEGIVDFTISVDEGSVFSIRNIEFLGNSVTRDVVLRRELLVNEGDPYNQELFEYSVLRLNQLGFFEEVKKEDAQIQTDERNKQVDITLRVKEKGRQQIQFTGGISGIGGSFIGLTYSTNNLFGYGESLSLDAQTGNRQRNISISYTEPYFLGKPISLGVSVFSTRQLFVNGINSNNNGGVFTGFGQNTSTLFTQESKGLVLSFNAPLSTLTDRFRKFSRFSRMGLSYSYSSTKIIDPKVNTDNDKTNDILVTYAQPSITASTITPSFVYNTLNSNLDPTAGKNLTLALGVSGLGGKVKTIAPTIEFKAFRPMKFLSQGSERPAVFGMHFLGQHIISYGTPLDSNSLSFVGGIPISTRFFMGGENTVRGYNIRSVSPVAEVRTILTTSDVVISDLLTGKKLSVLKPGHTINGVDQSVINNLTFKDRDQQYPGFPKQFTQVGGDTQLLMNLEYRVPIVGPISMAFFADGGTAFNLGKLKDQFIKYNKLPINIAGLQSPNPGGLNTPMILNPRGLIATPKEIRDARTPETPEGQLPIGFRFVQADGQGITTQKIVLSEALGGLSKNFRASLGTEFRVQVPVLQVPFRLIFAYNPNARPFDKNNPDPRQFAIEQKFTVRFSIGRTF